MSMLVASIVAIAVVICCYVLTARKPGALPFIPKEPPTRGSWGWSVLPLAILIFLLVWSARGLVSAGPLESVLCAASLAATSVVQLWNGKIRKRLADLPLPFPLTIELLMLLVGAYLTFVTIELPSNPRMTSFWWEGMVFEIVLCLLFLTISHFLFQRTGLGTAIPIIALELAGIAEYFVVTFKNAPIMASDVLALGTAAAVSGGYTYVLSGTVMLSLALLAPTLLLVSLTPAPPKGRRLPVLKNLAVTAALVAVCVVGYVNIDFARDFNIVFNAWIPATSYFREGFVSSFVTQVQSFRPTKPENYTNEGAQKMLASYVKDYDQGIGASEERAAAQQQFDDEQPTVIAIMNESFSDLSVYDNLMGTYDGPQWFNSFDGALQKGTLYVAPFGGGTCNSEWEFLTGGSMAFMGSGVYPYMIYDMNGVENLAGTFKGLGYRTTAMHPNLATNWMRDEVYPTFGFDQFLDITDFTGAERYRNMVSDAATYDKILELLDQSDDPQFIFDVTMQNHGGYSTGALPADMVKNYTVGDWDNPELDEYLALIDESDRALQEFIEKLSKLDRKVVVVFFGDHQPSIAATYNSWLMKDDPSELVHEERARTTSYMIYANYDVPGTVTGTKMDVSTNFLGANMMNLIGGPLTDYQKAELAMQNGGMPVLNLLGYKNRDGEWFSTDLHMDDAKVTGVSKLACELQWLQYHQFFADGVHFKTGAGTSGTVWGRLGGA